ncbi:MAG: EAL domain-containing protein, partial [Gammaproteobacteria bacterium]|nr:EAL domain-containing protein [Gammaproteobacteria bacterium]
QLLERFPNERRLYQRLWERAFERESFSVEMPLAQQEREMPIYEINYHRLNNAQGQAVGALHIARNIQARQRGHEQLGYMNTHDPMTGLLNRRELLQRLRRALEAQRERGTACSLLYLDLDDYSQMLERAGGSACDRYLRELAALLASRVRQRDSVARVAGDKFALLLDNCAEAEARKVSDNLMDALREFTFEWRGHTLQTTASGGLIPLTGSADDPLPEAESLLALAADLCQTAKNAGRDRVHVYRDPRGGMLGGDEARLQLRQLEQCVQEEGGIELHYQLIRPITSATWGDHVEILARLRGPGMGDTLWQPTSFLPLAERYDLACQLDRKVIQKTFAWLAGQTILETRLKLCSFNLSLPSLLDTSFPEFVSEQLIQTRYAANCFCFEVRESDAVAHPAAVIQLCESLRALGCQMALDGAGTSAQSYALAARLPVDWLKLDARVVRSMKDDPVQQVMVEALTKVAEVSGKKTVALYIEDDDILKEVRRMGVHFGQGFRLANPRPLDELAPVTLEHGQGRR